MKINGKERAAIVAVLDVIIEQKHWGWNRMVEAGRMEASVAQHRLDCLRAARDHLVQLDADPRRPAA